MLRRLVEARTRKLRRRVMELEAENQLLCVTPFEHQAEARRRIAREPLCTLRAATVLLSAGIEWDLAWEAAPLGVSAAHALAQALCRGQGPTAADLAAVLR